jgi:hypothetical protein
MCAFCSRSAGGDSRGWARSRSITAHLQQDPGPQAASPGDSRSRTVGGKGAVCGLVGSENRLCGCGWPCGRHGPCPLTTPTSCPPLSTTMSPFTTTECTQRAPCAPSPRGAPPLHGAGERHGGHARAALPTLKRRQRGGRGLLVRVPAPGRGPGSGSHLPQRGWARVPMGGGAVCRLQQVSGGRAVMTCPSRGPPSWAPALS